jgi:O-antigen/teichoic acid export membrane protein
MGVMNRLARASSVVPSSVLALADQAAISLTSVLSSIAIGRISKADLGDYGVAFAVVITITCIQDAVFGIPFVVLSKRQPEPKSFLGSSLVGVTAFGILASLLLGVGILAASPFLTRELSNVLLVVCGAAPFYILRLFLRRVFFASLRVDQALMLDLSASVIHVAIVGWSWYQSQLNAMIGHLAFGLSSAVVVGWWFYWDRASASIVRKQLLPDMHRNWEFARPMLGSHVFWVLHIQLATWMLMYLHGKELAGEFTACLTTILFANPIVLGLLNLFSPRAARSYEQGGAAALRKEVAWGFLWMVGAVSLLWVVMSWLGDPIIQFLFGREFQGHQAVITLLGLSMLAETACKAPESGLVAMEQPRWVAKINFVRLLVSGGIAWLFVGEYGLWGAAAALAVSDVVGAILMVLAFWKATATPLLIPMTGQGRI